MNVAIKFIISIAVGIGIGFGAQWLFKDAGISIVIGPVITGIIFTALEVLEWKGFSIPF